MNNLNLWCKKCGAPMLAHEVQDMITVEPCRNCLRSAVREAVKAGRLAAIAEYGLKEQSDEDLPSVN